MPGLHLPLLHVPEQYQTGLAPLLSLNFRVKQPQPAAHFTLTQAMTVMRQPGSDGKLSALMSGTPSIGMLSLSRSMGPSSSSSPVTL